MNYTISDYEVECGGYVFVEFTLNDKPCSMNFPISDIDVEESYYGGDRECGCTYGGGYSVASAGVTLDSDITYFIGSDELEENEFMNNLGISESDLAGMKKEFGDGICEWVEDYVKSNPEDFLSE